MLIFIIFIILSLMAIIGYGKIFQQIFFDKKVLINNGLVGFFGLFFLSFISYLTHLVYPHNFVHNSVLLIVGILFFLIFSHNEKIKISKSSYIILILLFIGVFIAKSHDDFPYYHLPNAIHFTQNKLEFGLGNLNHGFKHHSSIFYLYSVFYLPFIEIYLFNALNFFFLYFISVFLFENIDSDISKREFNRNTFIKLIFLVLSISIFNRVGEYGSDITGQLMSLVLICLSFDSISKKEDSFFNLSVIITVLVYLITIKTYFVIYAILPIIVIFFLEDKLTILSKFFVSKLFIFFILTGILFVTINISATGCIIYPVSTLCFPNYFSWGVDIATINYLSDWYEIWSKAGAGPDFREIDPNEYIKDFNWLASWIDRYFFTKVSDFLLSILCGILVIYFVFRKNYKLKINFIKKEIFFLLGLFIIFIIWFLKFPSLRYGGYVIILSIITILFSKLFQFSNLNFLKIKKKFLILFTLSIVIFISKNFLRINKEFNYSAVDNFRSFPFFYVKDVEYKEVIINNEKVYKVEGMCWATNSPCLRNINKTIIRVNNYRIYLNK